ncbi:MAG TPA: SBBP repeat-containing protein [Candidatus Koribacter sp.]|jgi:hypothetical protein
MTRISTLFTLFLCVASIGFAQAPQTTTLPTRAISFEPNQGQADSQVQYLFHGNHSALALSENGTLISYRAGDATLRTVHMSFANANADAKLTAENQQAGKVNYLIGRDPAQWHTNLPTFAQVRYQSIYPGVDAVFYGKEGNLEYDLVVAPNASPDAIALQFDEPVRIDANGDLVIGSEIRQHRPEVYQTINGQRRNLEASFKLRDDHTVEFAIANYDRSRELVIDPTLVYSTLIGTTYYNSITAVAVDGSGNVYATGATNYNFPTKNAFQGNQPSQDAFVTKFSSTGGSLIYSTYLGGNGVVDAGNAIGVDRFGYAYVVGRTDSSNWPITSNAFQKTNGGGKDGFVTKLSATGSSLVYSSYLGGLEDDDATALAIDSQHRLYVTGYTCSTNFPVTSNAYQKTSKTGACAKPSPGSQAFVTRVNASGSALDYSTYLGGTVGDGAYGIAVDSSYNAYVTGSTGSPDFPVTAGAYQKTLNGADNVFVTKFSPTGKSLVYSTFIGGSSTDFANAIALDSSNNAYVTGETQSTNYPVTSSAYQKSNRGMGDAFVTKLNSTGSSLVYSTYLGGSQTDVAYSIAVDSAGEAHVAGATSSTDFPVRNALQSTFGGNYTDAFITKLSASGSSRVYSTYFGGSGDDTANCIRLDASGNAYVGGETQSSNFHTTSGAYQRALKGTGDGFVLKIKP